MLQMCLPKAMLRIVANAIKQIMSAAPIASGTIPSAIVLRTSTSHVTAASQITRHVPLMNAAPADAIHHREYACHRAPPATILGLSQLTQIPVPAHLDTMR